MERVTAYIGAYGNLKRTVEDAEADVLGAHRYGHYYRLLNGVEENDRLRDAILWAADRLRKQKKK